MRANVSTTLKATLAVLSLLYAYIFLKIHKSTRTLLPNDNFDHRHQGERASSFSFDPITITSQHLNHSNDSSSLYLPEALRLPLYSNASLTAPNNPKGSCCQMAFTIRNKAPPPKNIMCDGICYTKRACLDPMYPFTSIEQVKFFTEKKIRAANTKNSVTRAKCMNANMRPPDYTWCHQWMVVTNVTNVLTTTVNLHRLESSYNHRNIQPLGKLPPPGCSQFTEGGGGGSYQHLMLFPEGKLAFCGIPKVSITQWLQFLRFTFGAKDYQVRVHDATVHIII